MTMTTEQKKEIQSALKNYVDSFPSQRKAVETLSNCSEATIIAILTNKWESVGEKMWLSIGKQLGVGKRRMKLVETLCFQTLILYYSIAKEEGATFAMVGGGGFGKSVAGEWYSANNRDKNVFYLECAEFWNKKYFLQKLLQAMSINPFGLNVPEMMETIVREMRRRNQPLVILDEIDKLQEPVLKFFITFYNQLNGLCGFVWTSTDAIEKKITKGINKRAVGYQELFSRIGASFIQLPPVTKEEVLAICQANGINDREVINTIANEVHQLGGDLRRIERNFLKNEVRALRDKQLKAA
jgi:Cdc6-like AAA superfamily ATPase